MIRPNNFQHLVTCSAFCGCVSLTCLHAAVKEFCVLGEWSRLAVVEEQSQRKPQGKASSLNCKQLEGKDQILFHAKFPCQVHCLVHGCFHSYPVKFYFVLFCFYFLARGEWKEKERQRNISVQEIHQLVSSLTFPARDLAHHACAVTGNWTCNLLVHRPVLNPLSHTGQGSFNEWMNERMNKCGPEGTG